MVTAYAHICFAMFANRSPPPPLPPTPPNTLASLVFSSLRLMNSCFSAADNGGVSQRAPGCSGAAMRTPRCGLRLPPTLRQQPDRLLPRHGDHRKRSKCFWRFSLFSAMGVCLAKILALCDDEVNRISSLKTPRPQLLIDAVMQSVSAYLASNHCCCVYPAGSGTTELLQGCIGAVDVGHRFQRRGHV